MQNRIEKNGHRALNSVGVNFAFKSLCKSKSSVDSDFLILSLTSGMNIPEQYLIMDIFLFEIRKNSSRNLDSINSRYTREGNRMICANR